MRDRDRVRLERSSIARFVVTAAALLAATPGTLSARAGDEADGVLFREGFDDDRLPGRG